MTELAVLEDARELEDVVLAEGVEVTTTLVEVVREASWVETAVIVLV